MGYEGYELTPIVFITTETSKVMEGVQGAHCYNYLVKPYLNEDIKKVIDTFNKKALLDMGDKFVVIKFEYCIGMDVSLINQICGIGAVGVIATAKVLFIINNQLSDRLRKRYLANANKYNHHQYCCRGMSSSCSAYV